MRSRLIFSQLSLNQRPFLFGLCRNVGVYANRRSCSHKVVLDPPWLIHFNQNLSLYPFISLPFFTSLRFGSFYSLVFVCSQFFDLGSELAIGYAVSKLTSKFRQPLNLAISALLIQQFPLLQRIKVSSLLLLPKDSQNTSSSISSNSTPLSSIEKLITSWVEEPLDKYGAAFLISGRLTSISTILISSSLIRQGVDINSFFTSLGIPDILQEASGSFGAATIINSILLPFHMWFAVSYSPTINSFIIKIRKDSNS